MSRTNWFSASTQDFLQLDPLPRWSSRPAKRRRSRRRAQSFRSWIGHVGGKEPSPALLRPHPFTTRRPTYCRFSIRSSVSTWARVPSRSGSVRTTSFPSPRRVMMVPLALAGLVHVHEHTPDNSQNDSAMFAGTKPPMTSGLVLHLRWRTKHLGTVVDPHNVPGAMCSGTRCNAQNSPTGHSFSTVTKIQLSSRRYAKPFNVFLYKRSTHLSQSNGYRTFALVVLDTAYIRSHPPCFKSYLACFLERP